MLPHLTLNCPPCKICHIEPKFWFQFKKAYPKNFLRASRLWVGRRQEPTLGYIPKTYEKNSGSGGLKEILEKSKFNYFNKSTSIISTNQSNNNSLYKLGLWIWHWSVKKHVFFSEKGIFFLEKTYSLQKRIYYFKEHKNNIIFF